MCKYKTQAEELAKTPEGAVELVFEVIRWARNVQDTKHPDDYAVRDIFVDQLNALVPEAGDTARKHGTGLGILDEM